MTSELMPRLGGARAWKDDEKLECVSVVPDGPDGLHVLLWVEDEPLGVDFSTEVGCQLRQESNCVAAD